MNEMPKDERETETREMFLSKLIKQLKGGSGGGVEPSMNASAVRAPETSQPAGPPVSAPSAEQSLQSEYQAVTRLQDQAGADSDSKIAQSSASRHSVSEGHQSNSPRLDTISVRELVQCVSCSVRLRNLVVTEPMFAQWTVGAAVWRMEEFRPLLFDVPGLGRKSVNELIELLLDAGTGSIKLTPPSQSAVVDSMGPQPQSDRPELDQDVLTLSLDRIIRFHGCSGRLETATERADLDTIMLIDYLDNPSVLKTALRECPGIGNKTTDEAVLAVERFIEAAIAGAPAIQAFVSAPADPNMIGQAAKAGAEQEKSKDRADKPINPETARLVLEELVLELPERQHYVLVRRYGLTGHVKQTLQQIADEVHVTRERVRQIESQALRQVKLPANSATLLAFLDVHQDDIWQLLSGGNELATDIEVKTYSRQLDPFFILAMDAVHGSVRQWLDHVSTRLDSGWLAKTANADDISCDSSRIEAWLNVHSAVMLAQTVKAALDLDDARLELAAEHATSFSISQGYLVAQRVGPKIRRTIRLHSLAVRQFGAQPFDIATLAAHYREEYTDDDVASRMFQMQMEEAPHLFCRLFDNIWFALGMSVEPKSVASVPFERQNNFPTTFETGSIGADMARLMTNGPWRHIDLRNHIVSESDGGVAASSIGAILSSNPCFRRVAPGIFDIHRQGVTSSGNDNTIINETLLTSAHCRAYCLARHSGAPVDWYPAWGHDLELWLTRWARLGTEDDLYASLLSFINPDNWNAPDIELAYWRRQKSENASWLLGASRKYELGRRFVEADRMLATLAQLAFFGWTSWVAVNRTTDARGDVHDAADLLSILMMAGLVKASNDWQAKHIATGKALELFVAASREMHLNGALSWDRGVLAGLLAGLGTSSGDSYATGWVERDEFSHALIKWKSGDARSGKAFAQKVSENTKLVDPEAIFDTPNWKDLFEGG